MAVRDDPSPSQSWLPKTPTRGPLNRSSSGLRRLSLAGLTRCTLYNEKMTPQQPPDTTINDAMHYYLRVNPSPEDLSPNTHAVI